MEKLVDSGLLAGVIDVTTTEIADEIGGGVLSRRPDAAGCDHPQPRALCRLLRRAGHGQLLGAWTRCRRSIGPEPACAQSERDADAHHGRGMPAHRPVPGRQAQPHAGAGAVPDPAGRRVVTRRAGQAVLGSGRRQGAVRRAGGRLPRRHRPQARASCRTTSTTRPSSTRWSRTSTRSPASGPPRRGFTVGPCPASPAKTSSTDCAA